MYFSRQTNFTIKTDLQKLQKMTTESLVRCDCTHKQVNTRQKYGNTNFLIQMSLKSV